MLGNVRAMRAVMNLTSTGAERFSDALKENAKAAGATERGADAIAKGAGKMAREYDVAKAKADALVLAVGDRTKGPLLKMRLGVLGVADALSKDLIDSFDVAEERADRFADSKGFGAIDRISKVFNLARAGAEYGAAGLEAIASKGFEIAAVAPAEAQAAFAELQARSAAERNDKAGFLAARGRVAALTFTAEQTRRVAEADRSRMVSERANRIGFIAQQIYDPAAAEERARLARIGRGARAELAEAGGVHAVRDRRRAAQNVKAAIGAVNVVIEGGASVDTAIASARALGEGLGDKLATLVGDQTKAAD